MSTPTPGYRYAHTAGRGGRAHQLPRHDTQALLAADEASRAPIEERRQALLDYLDSTVTWRADHRLEVGLEEASLRVVLAGLAADAALVSAWLCDDLGLIYGMTYGELAAWIKDQLG